MVWVYLLEAKAVRQHDLDRHIQMGDIFVCEPLELESGILVSCSIAWL